MNNATYESLLDCQYVNPYFDNSRSFRINILIVGIIDMLASIPTICLNALVLLVFIRKRKLRKGGNKLLFSLSITDLLSGIFIQPFLYISIFISYSQGTAQIPCILLILAGILGYAVACVSLLMVSFISLERFIAIFYPYKHINIMTPRMLTLTCIGIWIGSTIIVTSLIFRNMFFEFFLTNAIIITFTYVWNTFVYVRITRKVQAVRKEIKQMHSRFQDPNPDASRSKATQIAASIMVALLICYFPQVVLSLVNLFNHNTTFVNVYLDHWAMTFALFSSGLNPIFYCYYNSEIRNEVLSLLYFPRKSETQDIYLTINTTIRPSTDGSGCWDVEWILMKYPIWRRSSWKTTSFTVKDGLSGKCSSESVYRIFLDRSRSFRDSCGLYSRAASIWGRLLFKKIQ